jgi:adenine-specific DNA-methyltransferase
METLDRDSDGSSLNIVQDNLDKLKNLFPDIFSEGKIDYDKLRETLGNYLETDEERYNFTWHGKSKARRIAQTVSTGTLRPCKAESKHWDTTQNLFIEGDNLEVLKLLQKSYHKQVKMIYIDPPYNTGKEFIYPDNYKDNLDTYLEYTGQKDSEGRKFGTNAETSGRYHTNWLNMMYPRLKLARNLLQDDGAIFISIDDNEVANLRKLCDEIFGEENFVASICWKHTEQSKNDERYFSRQYNYLISYRKTENLQQFRFPRTDEDNRNYSNPDNDINGLWRSGDVRSPNYRKTLCFEINTPSGKKIPPPENGWRWSQEEIEKKISTGEIIFNQDETKIIRKIYLKNQEGRTPENIWQGEQSGTTRQANSEIKTLFFGIPVFDTPKPSSLIKRVNQLFGNDNDYIVMDFFSGSCTSAHAVMDLNAQDAGTRKFIMVQLPEPCDENTEAFKAGYQTIADIGKDRIRRAGDKIKSENADKEGIENLDIGFKAFKLSSSNIKPWDADFDNLEDTLLNVVDNIKDDRSQDDVLYEILLKYGLDLTVPIEERQLGGKTLYSIGFGALVICLEDEITIDVAEAIGGLKAELEPEVMRVVFKDSGFDDVVKTNVIQILKKHGIDDVKSL